MNKIIFIFIAALFVGCKSESSKQLNDKLTGKTVVLKYAKGFSITDYGTYKILEIINPWPKAEKSYRFALLKDNYDVGFWNLEKQRFDNTIQVPVQQIVVTSTTHIPALELLEVENTLVGFPGTNYISSNKVRQQIEKGNIRDLVNNEALNTEVLLELNPDVLVGFGIDGKNKSFEIIKKSGVPVIFNGDWVEGSPLAKAEWIKFFGSLYNKEKEADSIFNTIEKNYLEAKALANEVNAQPTVLSGAMHNEVWYLPNGTSTEAQLLKDANVNYLWKDSKGTGSLKLNFESVFVKAKGAEIWLSPSNYTSLESLKNGNEHHAIFTAYQNKNIFSFTNTTGVSGGVMYYELGMTRPDLVLKDLIKICHPELLKDYELFFFKRLN